MLSWDCIALHCLESALACVALGIDLHRVAMGLHCIALPGLAMHCIALHGIALPCMELHCLALFGRICVGLDCIVLGLQCFGWYHFGLHRLHCIALDCISIGIALLGTALL